ncbi:thyroid adenoma-associated protein homolog [Trichonephila inaurata madagascariensis]|uniref:tRNA (32-2'-O)-methyltransferase regulator THADA n=1 Tax=Trichonephila inaurata madagascariensis TaxID=2747483 RepID=A0A8X7C461_9ARAC|nr:thyroid adenoma-associated protein homolog [Trichonephila inaurata madagascariensis]
MRAKKKSCEKIVFHLPEDVLYKVKRNPESCFTYFMDINSSSDAVQQINLLKEIQNILSRKDPAELFSSLDLNILCFMFYQSPMKSSHKKTLNRILQNLSHRHGDAVKTSLECSLETFLSNSNQSLSANTIEKCTDCLLGLFDNFPIGPSVIEEKYEIVWKCLSDIFKFVLDKLKEPNCTDLYGTCQLVLKIYILVVQNCKKIRTLLLCNKDGNISFYSCSIIKAFEVLLLNSNTALNCRLNAGIALCYYYSIIDYNNFKASFFNQNENSLFDMEKFPLSSQLCLISGAMAVFPSKDFVTTLHENLIAEILLQKILHISECVEDSDLLLLCTRDLIQWTNVMSSVLTVETNESVSNEKTTEFKRIFLKDGSIMELLFQYVLRYREHYVDTLRHLSKDLFKNILNLHILSLDIDPRESPLLKKMTCFLLNDLPRHSQGKFGLLSCIIDIIGTNTVLQWFPLLPDALYEALKEVNLVSHVSELLETLFRKSLISADNEVFTEIWLKPLLKFLNLESRELSSAMNEHMLPKLFKVRPYSLHFLLSELSVIWEEGKGNCFSALITCVKFHQRQKLQQSIFDFISFASLIKALCHADDQVRLSAFSLICENSKTTEIIPADIFKLIKVTLPYNINCQAPAFRQQMVSYMKKLMNRMVESKYSLDKKKQTAEEDIQNYFNSVTKTYEEFISWLKEYLYSCLYVGANFPRRVSALNLLFLLHTNFSGTIKIVNTLAEAQTLLYALQDTYENNKIISLQILQSSDASILELEDAHFLEILLQTALILASSTKPPDTVTAAYMFAFMVKCKNFEAHLMKFLLRQVEEGVNVLPCEKDVLVRITDSSSFITMLLLTGVLLKHLIVAQKSLLDAAAYAPLYGVLACIRSVISQLDFKLLNDELSLDQWSLLIHELISLSIKVASVVEPVVCNSSPEGHLPMDTDSDSILQLQATVRRAIGKRFQSAVVGNEGISLESDQVVLDMVKTHAVTAQILLLCCWRTHKEISLLFGEISDKVPVKNSSQINNSGILDITQVLDIGEYFMRQMTLVKHKGAFEQAFIGFSKLCHMLWRSLIPKLQELPKIWLNDLVLAIKGLKDNMNLCSTRRSAGLPFIMQALLTSEPGLSSSLFFKDTISSLLSMASIQKMQGNLDEKVHALNILRALFRDACLSDILIPFVSEALKVSITGFKSQSWAVRNSSTLLFSALMTRIFGVISSQDEGGRKNRLTGRTFFSYYKETYAFLFDELKHCASVLSQNQESVSLVPALYPILLLLGRLYPAPGECDSRLVSFLPFLDVCSSSPIWKVRVLVAKAMVPLISAENFLSTLQSLFNSLPHNGDVIQGHNTIHGKCLQILYLLREYCHLSEDHKELIEKNLYFWIHSHSKLATKCNTCYTTRAAFLDVILTTITTNTTLDVIFLQDIIKDVLSELALISKDPDKEHYLNLAVVVALLSLQKMEQIEVHKFFQNMDCKCDSVSAFIQFCLLTPYESIQSMVLQFLVCLFRKEDRIFGLNSDSSISPIFFSNVISISVCDLIKNHSLVFSDLSTDRDLSIFVLKMLAAENVTPSSLGMVFHLLYLMPSTTNLEWDFIEQAYCSCVKLEYVLSHLENSKRDDISNPILLFSTHLAVKICTLCIQKSSSNSSSCTKCLTVLKKWSEILEESSGPENCISRRRAVVVALQIMPYELLLNRCNTLDNFVIKLWQSLLFLLTDDEPEIKHLSAELVMKMKATGEIERRILPVVPSLALDNTIDMFINAQICSPSQYVSVLLNWMLSCEVQAFDCVGDEQPFDRGELNVFAEDLLLTNIVYEHLSKYLESQIVFEIFDDLKFSDQHTIQRY